MKTTQETQISTGEITNSCTCTVYDSDSGEYESAVTVRKAPDLWRLRGVLDGVDCNHF